MYSSTTSLNDFNVLKLGIQISFLDHTKVFMSQVSTQTLPNVSPRPGVRQQLTTVETDPKLTVSLSCEIDNQKVDISNIYCCAPKLSLTLNTQFFVQSANGLPIVSQGFCIGNTGRGGNQAAFYAVHLRKYIISNRDT